MDIDSWIEESNKLNEEINKLSDDQTKYIDMMYDNLGFRLKLLMIASMLPLILGVFIDLYIPVIFLNIAMMFLLAIFDFISVDKKMDKSFREYTNNINKLYNGHTRYAK